jgi:Ti-type conjugative transfer relaxase TraA
VAIFHLHCRIISRSAGRVAIAAAAYRAGERLRDERTGQVYNYSRKQGVSFRAILAPKGSPSWVFDRQVLWNKVEQAETRKDAQLARDITLALPVELDESRQQELLLRYVQKQFVDFGMIADCNIHRDNPDNPHAHILLTLRPLDGNGFGPKCRTWNDRRLVTVWRDEWAIEANRTLALAGHQQRIDARSYVDQGINLVPTIKLGTTEAQIDRDVRRSTRARLLEHREIRQKNGAAILRDPSRALRALTHHQATFTRADIAYFLKGKTADANQLEACLGAIMASPDLVPLSAKDKTYRMTTKEMLATECRMMALVDTMFEKPKVESIKLKSVLAEPAYQSMTDEQQAALKHILCDTHKLALVEGYAGTGKTKLLGVARSIWEQQGKRVLGAALSGKAAEGLEAGAGMNARSLTAWEYAWQSGRDKLYATDVLVIDEAAMVGTRQMGRVLKVAKERGAKVVMVGDIQQLQAIEAGAPFRAIGERIGHAVLTRVQRQESSWQREASVALARGQTYEGLKSYSAAGSLKLHGTSVEAEDGLIHAWHQAHKEDQSWGQLLLGYSRQEVNRLNLAARTLLQTDGKLRRAYAIKTARGSRVLAQGERIVFLRNDRRLGVLNGSLGTVEKVSAQTLQVRLDGPQNEPRRAVFSLADYNHLDYGYAVTVHKAQGMTVDRSFLLASSKWDRHAAYVALTRHRKTLALHYAKDQFSEGEGSLICRLSRTRKKDMALDHLAPQNDDFSRSQELPEHRAIRNHLSSLPFATRRKAAPDSSITSLPTNLLIGMYRSVVTTILQPRHALEKVFNKTYAKEVGRV